MNTEVEITAKNQIRKTYDYNSFVFFESNRPAEHYLKIAESIKERDLTPYNPIITMYKNGMHWIIDDQTDMVKDSYAICYKPNINSYLEFNPKIILGEEISPGDIIYSLTEINKDDFDEYEIISMLSYGADDLYIIDDLYDSVGTINEYVCNMDRYLKVKNKTKVLKIGHYSDLLDWLKHNKISLSKLNNYGQ